MGANGKAGIFWPYSQMLLGMNSNQAEDVLGAKGPIFFGICILYLVFLVGAGIKLVKIRR